MAWGGIRKVSRKLFCELETYCDRRYESNRVNARLCSTRTQISPPPPTFHLLRVSNGLVYTRWVHCYKTNKLKYKFLCTQRIKGSVYIYKWNSHLCKYTFVGLCFKIPHRNSQYVPGTQATVSFITALYQCQRERRIL
jgi:hypothetical protein